MEQLKKLGNAKRVSLADYLERSHRNDEKTIESENMLSALTDRFAALKSAKLEVPELYKQFTVCYLAFIKQQTFLIHLFIYLISIVVYFIIC